MLKWQNVPAGVHEKEVKHMRYGIYNMKTGLLLRRVSDAEAARRLLDVPPSHFQRMVDSGVGINGLYIRKFREDEQVLRKIPSHIEYESLIRGLPVMGIKDNRQVRFNSVGEAARKLGISRSAIFHALAGRQQHAAGIVWQRVPERHHLRRIRQYI